MVHEHVQVSRVHVKYFHIFPKLNNPYREVDRGTKYFRRELMLDELKDRTPSEEIDRDLVQRILFKSVVYRLINKIETFEDFGGLPTQEGFSSFLKFLSVKKSNGEVIFTAAHQNMGLDR